MNHMTDLRDQNGGGMKLATPKFMTHLRIPTQEQFAYLEVDFLGTTDEALEEYKRLTGLIKGGTGLPNKQFIAILDELWTKHSIFGDPGIVSEMSQSQQEIIRAFKLCISRNK